MRYNQDKHNRKSIRLKGYDYSQNGGYFVTICTHNKQCLFGDIVDGNMELSEMGKIAEKCWNEIPDHFDNASLDYFVIMPNHIHAIVNIVGAKHLGIAPTKYFSQSSPNASPLQLTKGLAALAAKLLRTRYPQ